MAAARQTQAPRIPACNVSPALSAVEHVKPASTSDACPAVTADVTMQQPEACSGQTASKLQGLYPLIEAYDAGMLVVDGEVGHELYYEQCGNPDGVPALFLHGGPGLGSGLAARCFFNPRLFRIIVFDQRGSGRSRPLGCIERNTTGHLLADIERVRVHLGVEAWGVVVGGSWGSLLAVAYAQLQPLRVQALVLRGTFLGSAAEIRWLFEEGGASEHYPDAWERYQMVIPAHERGAMVQSYYHRLLHEDASVRKSAAVQFIAWEEAISRVCEYIPKNTTRELRANIRHAEANARIECHYMANNCFLHEPLLSGVATMAQIPTSIVHGRLDMVCRPRTSHALHRLIPGSALHFVHDAGHSVAEPALMHVVMREIEKAGRHALQNRQAKARLSISSVISSGTMGTSGTVTTACGSDTSGGASLELEDRASSAATWDDGGSI